MNHYAKQVPRSGSSMVEVVLATLLSGVVIVGALNVMGSATKIRVAGVAHVDGPLLANELLAEIMSKPYEDPEEPGTGPIFAVGLESGESTRSTFDDVDDYLNYSESPPLDVDEVPMSQYLGWTRSATTWYARRDNGGSWLLETGLKGILVQVTAPDGTVTERTGYRWKEGVLEGHPAIDSETVTWIGAELQIGASGLTRAGTNLINEPSKP